MFRIRIFFVLLVIVLASTSVADVTDLVVHRFGDGYEVSWRTQAPDATVDLLVGDKPDLHADAMVPVAIGVAGDRAFIANQVGIERPYFYAQTESGVGMRAAERLLPLEGSINFRDLGGYAAADGRRVKWGRLYRSGSLHGLTNDDYQYLSSLGIRVVCDLRAPEERRRDPTRWRGGPLLAHLSWDYEESDSTNIGAQLRSPDVDPASLRAQVIANYPDTAYEQAEHYKEMFGRLLSGEAPLIFHCNAGKDRAGTGSALLLSALGVSRQTIVQDYALSEVAIDYRAALVTRLNDGGGSGWDFLGRMPRSIVGPLLRSDPAYIESTLDTLTERHGSILGFLAEVVDVGPAEIAKLRDAYLE